MRVLHIHTTWARGGAALSMRDIHEGLGERPGIESRALVGEDRSDERREDVTALLGHRRWLANVALARLTGLEGIVYPVSRESTFREAVEWADVVNLHNLHGYYLPLELLHLLALKPVVWTIRDYWAIAGSCTYPGDCNRWRDGCGHCPDIARYPRSMLFDLSRSMMTYKRHLVRQLRDLTLVTISRNVRQVLLTSHLQGLPIEVIYNGIDIPAPRPAPPDGDRHVLYCLNVLGNKIKGGREFVEVMLRVKARSRTVFHLFGVSLPGSVRDELLRAGVRLHEHGYLQLAELYPLYARCDLFVTTSYDETFGRTTIEAFGSGTDVMAWDVPIMKEIAGAAGHFVAAGDVAALAARIDAFFDEDQRRPRQALLARAGRFSKERMLDAYEELYRRKLSGSCESPRGS